MIGRTNVASGGAAELNFVVVGGTTQPSNPQENTIWVDTITEITSYVFASSEPSSPSAGMVWFTTGAASAVAFAATEENPIYVYPVSAKQYISGAWTDVTAKTFQNGAWATWNVTTYWFTAGEGPTDTWNTYASGQSAVYINASRIQLLDEYASSARRLTSKAKVNLTNFNTLYFDADADGSANATFGVASSLASDTASVTFAKSVYQSSRGRTEWELDVSDLSGEYYIAIRATGAGSVFVYNIYGE